MDHRSPSQSDTSSKTTKCKCRKCGGLGWFVDVDDNLKAKHCPKCNPKREEPDDG